MPLPRFLFNQERPDLICADRELHTSEIHHANDFYGQASVLKRYAGLPQRYALKGVLEHGLSLRSELWEVDRDAPLPMNFAFSPERAEIFLRSNGKPTETIGFGYLYAMRIVDQRAEQVGPRQGTLAFPCHSSHLVKCHFDHAEYADRLKSLPRSMQPVVVCAYWADFLAGAYRPYERCGLPLVSAGHIFDRDFLLRLHDICRRFQFAVSNRIGTHLFQSFASGCDFSYCKSSEVSFELPDDERQRLDRGRERLLATHQHSWRLFGPGTSSIRTEQASFVDRALGRDYVRSPAELRAVLDRAEQLDQGSSHRRSVTGEGESLTLLARQSRRLRRLGRSISKRLPHQLWRKSA